MSGFVQQFRLLAHRFSRPTWGVFFLSLVTDFRQLNTLVLMSMNLNEAYFRFLKTLRMG